MLFSQLWVWCLFTYLTPYLLQLFPQVNRILSFYLILSGLACFLGNLYGGYVSDKIGYKKSLLLGTFCQVLLTLLLFIFQHHFWISLILFFCWQFMGWFVGLQLNTGISIRPQNKSSFILSLNSSNIQPGQAIGLSIAVLVIKAFGIQSLTLLTLSSALLVLMIASLLKERN